MSDPKPFHRIFGLSWFDFFQGAAFTVAPELDLSFKQQFLDLALIRTRLGPTPRPPLVPEHCPSPFCVCPGTGYDASNAPQSNKR